MESQEIPCDKPIAGGILEQLIDAKINHLFNVEGDKVMARVTRPKRWWMRGLKEERKLYPTMRKRPRSSRRN